MKKEDSCTKILLHRRQNTGYQDGRWDIAGSGHVDEGEYASMAAIRECMEETGIEVAPEDLTFVHLSHHISRDRTYYDIYFVVNAYKGEPRIMEPDKCSELEWFDILCLPADMVEVRKQDIKNYLEGKPYSEKTER
ncbi:MAG: NUDIX domain-containing protein [Clostridiaceae bacterium]|nr:NUDIX domain-containing protein [Clostridiaceae bacterium]